MSDKYMELDRVLDEESWDWLNDNVPPLAVVVQRLVEKGISPEDIRRRVVDRQGAHRLPLATRCESAARYLVSAKV